MNNIYKVTAAKIKTTRKGHELYNLQLDGSTWATRFIPTSQTDRSFDRLYKFYVNNNKSLDGLVGNYVSLSLQTSEYGTNFESVNSIDVFNDFKSLLDQSRQKAFITRINIYEFLKKRNYPLNFDDTITLREPYNNWNVAMRRDVTLCFPNRVGNDLLSLANIEVIYNEFYKNKIIDNGNPDRDERYSMNPVSIIISRTFYQKNRSGGSSKSDLVVLSIGDRLSEEQYRYLLNR